MSRTTSRKHAFIAVYQLPFHFPPGGAPAEPAEFAELIQDYLAGVPDLSRADQDFICAEARGVADNLEAIDALIAERAAQGWSMDRLNKIDLAVLRLAIFELAHAPDIPTGVSINEAVELCKAYGDDASPAFVNGVLAGAARALRPGESGRNVVTPDESPPGEGTPE